MPGPKLQPIDHPDLPPHPISPRLRTELVYFASPPETPGIPSLGPDEFFFEKAEVDRILDDGFLSLVSPLDTANMTEVDLNDEQEDLLLWLQKSNVQHVRLIP